ncbi:MAG TPA: HAMP domain-containing sensor histidine kinase [Candidatus Limnocylindrales bacterium]|jgi:two-component system sensor histidine kinase MtrB|nr:HAMP domain-containing sensor histidine kinase [Candidatus Limnocylindrales bacterium]
MLGRSFRRRLVVAFVGLAALAAALVGVGAYLFASVTLNERLLQESRQQASFNIETLSRQLLSDRPTKDEVIQSGLAEAFFLRGGAETIIDFGDGDPYLSALRLGGALELLSPELKQIVASGNLGYQRVTVGGEPYLVLAGRRPSAGPGLPAGPDFYFFFPARGVDDALALLAVGLVVGGAVAILLAAIAGGLLARGVLRPVGEASAAAHRIAAGDLSARVPVGGDDEFGAWAASFNRMAGALEEKVAQLQEAQSRQRRFVSDVSHELRTPLTALVNEAQMLGGHLEALPADARRVGELLTTDVARLRVLVDDLMEISRFDAAVEELQLADIDLEAFLRAVVASRAPEAHLHIPAGRVFLRTDPRRLERIIGNLIDNARQHAGAAGLEVRADLRDGSAYVAVLDRGRGVDPVDLPFLFERFYKADPSRHGGSSGLGLAIARENAELLGGQLTARGREGGGMIFELRIPVTPSLRGGDGQVTARSEPEPRGDTEQDPTE